MSLLKPQREALSVVVGIITGLCIMGTHARRIGFRHLANDFCRSYRDEEENKTIPHLLFPYHGALHYGYERLL